MFYLAIHSAHFIYRYMVLLLLLLFRFPFSLNVVLRSHDGAKFVYHWLPLKTKMAAANMIRLGDLLLF